MQRLGSWPPPTLPEDGDSGFLLPPKAITVNANTILTQIHTVPYTELKLVGKNIAAHFLKSYDNHGYMICNYETLELSRFHTY